MSLKKTTFAVATSCFLSMGAFAGNIYQAPKPLMSHDQAKQCCMNVCSAQGQNWNGNWFSRPCGKESCDFMCGSSCKSSCETDSCGSGVCGVSQSNTCNSGCGFSLAGLFSCGSKSCATDSCGTSCQPKQCSTRSCVTNFVPERSYCGCAPRVA